VIRRIAQTKKKEKWLLRVEKNFAGSGSKKGYEKS
jgi:hypothetical protein